jgi:UDP-N-acetylglucosamine--N-acetylmuramyl-(pentapeptide) pyrophosphoryl-undecaprenol N-acetylglucosamine transferase
MSAATGDDLHLVNGVKVLLTGGGTGGHVYPALAIAEALAAEPTFAPLDVLFVGMRGGLEVQMVAKVGVPARFVSAAPLTRKFSPAIFTLFANLAGFFQAHAILHRFRPDVAIATGGYVTFPVIAALWTAKFLRLSRARIALLEPNARAGLTNRLLRPLVDEVWFGVAETGRTLARNEHLTGTPVRAAFSQPLPAPDARLALGLEPGATTIVVFGGSQGARTLNEAVAALAIQGLPDGWQLLLVSGERDFENVERCIRAAGSPRVRVVRYLDDPRPAFAAADLIVARAGASTLAELAATGTPAILVPYPYATDDHQTENAVVVERSGAARVVADRDLDERRLRSELEAALAPPALAALREAAHARGASDPRRAIVARVKSWTSQKPGQP